MPGAGALRERLTIQRNDPATLNISSLTRLSTTATATTSTAHGYLAGDYVTVAGATPSGYTGKVKILSVPTPTTFTYAVTGSLTTPATGVISVVYTSNAQGGRVVAWRTMVARIPAEMIPLRSSERLQLAAIQSDVAYRFRVRVRNDLEPTQRVLWTPSWPPSMSQQTLEITGVLPCDDGRQFMFLECSLVAA